MLAKVRSILIHYPRKMLVSLIACLFLCIISVSHVYAHKVYLFAWVEGEMVHTDSYFRNRKNPDS